MQVIDTETRASWQWLKDAFGLFRRQPLAWLGLIGAWLLASLFCVLVPFIGFSTMHLLQPAFFAGFMLACRDQEAGKPVMAAHLFAAFHLGHKTLRALLMIGAIGLLIGTLLSLALVGLGMPTQFPRDPNGLPDMQALSTLMQGKEWIAILGFFLTLLQMGIFWFVPPLLAFKPMLPSHALRWSFFAFLSNLLPMIIFGLVMLATFFMAAIPLLGLLLWMPLLVISNYTSYQRVFRE